MTLWGMGKSVKGVEALGDAGEAAGISRKLPDGEGRKGTVLHLPGSDHVSKNGLPKDGKAKTCEEPWGKGRQSGSRNCQSARENAEIVGGANVVCTACRQGRIRGSPSFSKIKIPLCKYKRMGLGKGRRFRASDRGDG